jgi:tyrosyl-tRNA synthetase
MTDSEAELAKELRNGAVEALPDGRLEQQLEEGRPLRIKLGIDPTAPDIHLGHCVVLDKLADFQRAGHEVVLIIGDYTARVGDPSGRDSQRPILAPAEIESNARTFQDQAFKILDPNRTTVRFNSEWLDMPMEDLFRLLGSVTVAQVLERDDFDKRIKADLPISVLEILYPLLQGYDSVAIRSDVELGGTDQKFNLLLGRDVQRSYGVPEQSIMCMPILPGIDGKQRMSKSLGNYVGVTEPPEEIFGKLMSIPDDAMPSYYKLVLRSEIPSDLPPNEAKRRLAGSVVARFHGESAAEQAEARFDQIHVSGEVPEDVEKHSLAGFANPEGDVHLPALISDLFAVSSSEARRLIEQGGVKLDGVPVTAEEGFDLPAPALSGRVLQVGKRRFVALQD